MSARSATRAWSSEEDEYLKSVHGTKPLAELRRDLGRSAGSLRGRITKLGLSKQPLWTAEEEVALRALYEKAGANGVLGLSAFALSVGREKGNVCRKAKLLGLTINPHRKLVEVRKDRNKYDSPEELRAAISVRTKQWIRENGHPRGMAGKRHTAETKRRISAASKAYNLFQTEDQKQARYLKAMKTKVERHGHMAQNVRRGTWLAGWREIGGKRDYYRSRWEANYARYLQWLKERGQIADWQHEPETFWFEEIKRGVRSYLPDFRVWETNGTTALHEVKGWMDARSRTTLKRMRIYHPSQKIVLIDGRQYRAIRLKVMGMIPDWEDSKRDAHA